MRFDPDQELNGGSDPIVFNAMPMDYVNCEVDPAENPLHIQHAYLNRGEYPPEYAAQHDRFVEDVNNRTKPQEQVKKKLMNLTKLVKSDLNVFKIKAQKRMLNESMEDLRKSGKPFYWVDHERLRKLKQLCETYKEDSVRNQAVSALQEYKDTVSNYNCKNKPKINDIFPS